MRRNGHSVTSLRPLLGASLSPPGGLVLSGSNRDWTGLALNGPRLLIKDATGTYHYWRLSVRSGDPLPYEQVSYLQHIVVVFRDVCGWLCCIYSSIARFK